MIKKILISVVTVLFSAVAFARETDTLLTFEADSALIERYSKVNDYSLLGIDYSVSMARASFNPNRMQQSVFMPVNFGITYTKYCKMFGYMPYFGLQLGLQYSNEAYQFKENADGVVDYINYAYKATIQTIEVPVMAHLHYDFWKMKIMVNLGAFAGYRLSIHREYVDGLPDKYKGYENSFHPLENRFDYGIKGGAGLGLILDPIEIHFMCYYKYSLSNLHQPDVNNRTMERDEYSKYYYRWSYPTNLIFSLGIHYQLSRRNGRTRAMLRSEARKEAIMIIREDEKNNSENR